MSDRYRKFTHPGGARPEPGKSAVGVLWASICARLGIGPGGKKSASSFSDMVAGYQAQSGFESGDDGRVLRRRSQSRINPVTGTYYMGYSEPPRGRKLWPWIALAFAAICIYSFASNQGDPVNATPSNNPNAIAAMSNAGGPAANAGQNSAASSMPLITPRPTFLATQTPVPTPTPTPAAGSPMLKYGSEGDDVKELQGQLIALGYMALGKDDGDFGGITKAAVKSFQQVNGLVADGFAGEKTLALLYSGTAKKDPDVFVWAENEGKEYHSSKDCSDIKNPKQIKKSQAEKQKLKPCGKCY